MKYDCAIFDLDGTILNTLEDLADSINETLKKYGFPQRTLKEVRGFIGNGARKMVERSLPEGVSQETLERVLKDQKSCYLQHALCKTQPYPGIPALLKSLKAQGVRLAVITNKANEAVAPIINHYYPGIFDLIQGDRPEIPKKPAPDGVLWALKELGVSPDRAVYIGDSEVDIQTGHNAGLPVISVDWGYKDKDFLLRNGASVIVSDAKALGDQF